MSPRRSLLVVGALLGSSALAGCSYNSPQTTATPYAASDGVLGEVNSVGLRNVMLVSAAEGKPGQLYGSLVNSGDSTQKVTFSSETGSLPSVTVPAGQIVNLASKSMKVAKTSARPGESVKVTVSAGGQSTQVSVPVLDGTLPEYRTLVPSGNSSSKAAPAKSSDGAKATSTPKTTSSGKPNGATATASSPSTAGSSAPATP